MDETGLTLADFAELCDDYNNDRITYDEFMIKFWNKYYDAKKPNNMPETYDAFKEKQINLLINN